MPRISPLAFPIVICAYLVWMWMLTKGPSDELRSDLWRAPAPVYLAVGLALLGLVQLRRPR